MRILKIYTVITGASKGLGLSLAKKCAKNGRNLILISLPGENIKDVALNINKLYNVDVQTYETDLRDEQNIREVAIWIKSSFIVSMLINNAGVGGTQYFMRAEKEYLNTIIQLNMKALVLLTHELLPMLKLQKRAYILNIASMAAFGPMPYKTVYPASKAFVSSFSKGLDAELKGTGVSVTVAYPGGMITTPEIEKRVESYGRFIKSTFLEPYLVAEIILDAALKGKKVIIPGVINKVSRLLMRLMPEDIRLNMFRKNIKKELNVNFV
jgi:short-subunit dehydrogenase